MELPEIRKWNESCTRAQVYDTPAHGSDTHASKNTFSAIKNLLLTKFDKHLCDVILEK
jgi:hypothetical protein